MRAQLSEQSEMLKKEQENSDILRSELANFASIIRILKSRKDVFGKAPIAVPQQAKAKMLMELKADHTAASREELNIEKQLNAMLHE